MLTEAAARSFEVRGRHIPAVADIRNLFRAGLTSDEVRGHIRANRWQRFGRAVVLHNGAPSTAELRQAALIVLGPRAVLTAFTALDEWGLAGWEREAIHVLVPRGARVVRPTDLPLRMHYTGTWAPGTMNEGRRLHRPAHAAVLAAASFARPRPACGILAATVQQRLVRASDLVDAVDRSPRVRHRALLLAAAHDIAQGAEALSEIDFARLCRAAGLPEPTRQVARKDRFGRRRYLDVEWELSDGRRVVVEVDGAMHLIAQRWWGDELRQNELVIGGDVVLRYPSVIVRCEPALVIDQLQRMLLRR
jgi:hypothetical protein